MKKQEVIDGIIAINHIAHYLTVERKYGIYEGAVLGQCFDQIALHAGASAVNAVFAEASAQFRPM